MENIVAELFAREKTEGLTEAEQAQLKQLLEDAENREAYAMLEKMWQATPLPAAPNTDLAWQRLQAAMHAPQQGKIISLYKNWYKVAAAAAVILVACIFFLIPSSDKSIAFATGKAEIKTWQLPDGTTITLQPNSKVNYTYNKHTREVAFEGDAYFEVAKDAEHPFVITAVHCKTEVLGTAFHLLDTKATEAALLQVTEGRVKFSAGEKETEVRAGEKATWSQGELKKETDGKFNKKDWSQGTLSFDDATLALVLANLQSHFHESVQTENADILKCRFSGTFDRRESLDDCLRILAETNNLRYEKNGQVRLLKGEGCHE